jgi:hypothetical protein
MPQLYSPNAEKSIVLEISEAGYEKDLSIRELKRTNFLWALKYLRGKSFHNKSINKEITVSRRGLGEWKTVTKSREQAISIKILGKILENAIFWKKEKPKDHNPNIGEIIYFQQNCKINNKMYIAIITVKAYKSQNYHIYYHHYLDLDDFILSPKK